MQNINAFLRCQLSCGIKSALIFTFIYVARQSRAARSQTTSQLLASQGTWMVPPGLGSPSCHLVQLIRCQLVIHAAGLTAGIARGDLNGLIPRIRSPIANKVAVATRRVPHDCLLEGKLDRRLSLDLFPDLFSALKFCKFSIEMKGILTA